MFFVLFYKNAVYRHAVSPLDPGHSLALSWYCCVISPTEHPLAYISIVCQCHIMVSVYSSRDKVCESSQTRYRGIFSHVWQRCPVGGGLHRVSIRRTLVFPLNSYVFNSCTYCIQEALHAGKLKQLLPHRASTKFRLRERETACRQGLVSTTPANAFLVVLRSLDIYVQLNSSGTRTDRT